MVRIAYLILVHNNLDLVYKQIDVLVSDGTKFYIHIDKKFNSGPTTSYSQREDVVFINDRYNIHWGGFNMVKATIELLKEAANEKFDYYILLSGQCFPIKKRTSIQEFLGENAGKSFLQMMPLASEKFINGGLNKITNFYPFDLLGNLPDIFKKLLFRYLNKLLNVFGYRRRLPGDLIPYFGSQWWALSDETVAYLLRYIETNQGVFQFFRYSWAPDELVIQTILGNSPFRDHIINKPFRYIDWGHTDKNGSPKTLTTEDYNTLLNSEEFFARKFDPVQSAELIKALEKNVL
jgi:hypothetical protein